jgi:hypothetical protein
MQQLGYFSSTLETRIAAESQTALHVEVEKLGLRLSIRERRV